MSNMKTALFAGALVAGTPSFAEEVDSAQTTSDLPTPITENVPDSLIRVCGGGITSAGEPFTVASHPNNAEIIEGYNTCLKKMGPAFGFTPSSGN